MTVERSWRIDNERMAYLDSIPYPLAPEALELLTRERVLVPDTRLQAIADAYSEYVTAPLMEMGSKQSELNALLIALADE